MKANATQRENMIVLAVLQALQGVLTTNVKALTLEFPQEDLVAHFLLRADSDDDREEIGENFGAEVAAFTMGMPEVGDILVKSCIELVDENSPGYIPPGRRVFVFKD